MMKISPDNQRAEIPDFRRRAMLSELTAYMERHHRARRLRRRTLAAGMFTFALLLLAVAFTRYGNHPQPVPETISDHALAETGQNPPADILTEPTPAADKPFLINPPQQPSPARVAVMHSTPGITARYRVQNPANTLVKIELLDDETLLQALEKAGRPAGIIRTGNRVMLTRNVVDQPGNSNPSGFLFPAPTRLQHPRPSAITFQHLFPACPSFTFPRDFMTVRIADDTTRRSASDLPGLKPGLHSRSVSAPGKYQPASA